MSQFYFSIIHFHLTYLGVSQRELNPSVVEDSPVAGFNILKGAHKICIYRGLEGNLSFGSKLKKINSTY